MTTAALRFLHALGAALDRHRVLTYCRILLAVETVVFLFLVAGTHGLIAPLAGPTSTDFVSFYAAGALADSGTPELAYDQAAHNAAEQRATAPGVEYRFFYYPPVFLLLCAALARLPYLAAFLVFEAATLALCLTVMRAILAERGWSAIIPVLAFPAAFWTLGLGQNSFLTAALFGAGTLWIDRRPILAGLCFGALCYKPHFALLVPVALLAGRHWRALGAALGSAAALCGLSLIVFGWETWQSFCSPPPRGRMRLTHPAASTSAASSPRSEACCWRAEPRMRPIWRRRQRRSAPAFWWHSCGGAACRCRSGQRRSPRRPSWRSRWH